MRCLDCQFWFPSRIIGMCDCMAGEGTFFEECSWECDRFRLKRSLEEV